MRLEEKYGHVTAESITQMTQEQLEELQHQVGEDVSNIQMQLEMLQDSGGINREMAGQLGDYLPVAMVLESFTGQVTNTNYVIAKESLGTAAKVAMVVGLLAVVGLVGFVVGKILAGGKGAPKTDAVDKVNNASKSLEDLEVEANGRAYRAHLEEISKRQATLTELITEAGLSACGVSLFDGMSAKTDMIVRKADTLEIRARELSKNLNYLTSAGITVAERLGQDGDPSDLISKLEFFIKGHGGGRSSEEVIKTVITMHEHEDYFGPAKPAYIKEMLKHAPSKFPEYPMDDFKRVQKVREGFKAEQRHIEEAKKKLDGNAKIGKAASKALRDGFDDLAKRLKELDEVLAYIDREVVEYNRAAAIFAKAVGKTFEAVRARIMEDEMTKEERTVLLQKLDSAYRG